MTLPELLAPAGSFAAAKAALFAGADAIYVGGRMLNARMNASNFTDVELSELIKLAHGRGVKVFVTMNTAVLDREMAEAVAYTDLLYKMGTDALIVSDLGLMAAIKDRYPGMELHASTQASGHNAECAKAFEKLGFCRMVCARELSKREIDGLVKDSPIEIEQFVHGAMCVSQSGQCLASYVMGGRSGNRGVCAQPCRMRYGSGYPISLKDMCLAPHVTSLIESGVASLKIEGRMKSPQYVYEVVSAYRRLLDLTRNASKSETEALAAVFSRSGFTDGYYTENIGADMLGVRTDSDVKATEGVRTEIKDKGRRLPPITVNDRTPNGEFTQIKPPKKGSGSGKPILTARFLSADQVCRTDAFSHVYLPLDRYERDVCDGVVFPPSVFPSEEAKFLKDLERAVSLGATDALITHVGQIETALRYGLTPHGDYRLNVFNSHAARLYTSLGLRDVMLSPELTLPQIRDINAPKSVIVYGRFPIMLLTKPVGQSMLTDKTGARFPIIKENGRDVLINSVPIYMADKGKELDNFGVRGRHFVFTTETRRECFAIVEAYEKGTPSKAQIRRILK